MASMRKTGSSRLRCALTRRADVGLLQRAPLRRLRLKRKTFQLTWNCGHLANANKFGDIRTVNVLLGLHVPCLATRLELLGGEDDA